MVSANLAGRQGLLMDQLKARNDMLELEINHLKEQLEQQAEDLLGEEEYRKTLHKAMEETRLERIVNQNLRRVLKVAIKLNKKGET